MYTFFQYPIICPHVISGTSSLERGSKDGSQDVLSTVDEVFTSIDETNTLSSRTVSQDKISTITEVGN